MSSLILVLNFKNSVRSLLPAPDRSKPFRAENLFASTTSVPRRCAQRECRKRTKISCSRTRKRFLLICCVLAATLFACSHSNSGSARPLTATEAQGKQAYSLACMRCHEPFDLQTTDDGPSLHGLFKKPTLPSGAPATDEQVREVILRGRGKMRPADPAKLKPEDVEPLIQYLHTR